MSAVIACVAAFAVAFVGTGAVRQYASRRLVDVPNARSSHSTPTPRGGGIAIAIAHLAVVGAAWAVDIAPTPLALALGVGGLAVVIVGFIDDHRPLAARWRLAVHFGAAAWLLACLGRLPPVEFGAHAVDLGIAGSALAAVYVVWFLNLFNFMDGIDGIAGVQAVTMTVGAGLLAWLSGVAPVELLPITALTSAAAAFLLWNWPPARIFMGDAGSGYIGFALGCLAFWTVVEGWLSVWTWVILGGTFLADATTTLLVRAVSGESVSEAHRSHAYQRLSRYWRSHLPVTVLVGAVNLLWLLPWASVACRVREFGASAAAIALLPLFLAAWRLGAGRPGDLPGSMRT